MPTEPLADDLIALFREYRECFGISDEDFPDEEPQTKQCEFEDKFTEIVCRHRGHDLVPDQCMKVEHDFCINCGKRRDSIPEGEQIRDSRK